jgi:hypothetical protein
VGHAIQYCSTCGERIAERDTAMGRVLEASGNLYCPNCHAHAPESAVIVQSVPSETPTVLRGSSPPGTRRVAAVPRPRPPATNPVPIIAGVVAALLILAIAVYLLMPGKAPDPGPRGPKPAEPGAVSTEKKDEHKAAREALDALKAHRTSRPDDTEGLIAKAKAALATAERSPYEDTVRLILREEERKLETKKAESAVMDLLAKASKTAAGDPEFKKRTEIKQLFREARDAADKQAAHPLSLKVLDAERDYDAALEKASRDAAVKLGEKKEELLRQDKYDEAIALLDTYPATFRDTVEGRNVEAEKRRIRELKEMKETEPTVFNDYQRATQMMNDSNSKSEGENEKGYKESVDLYMKVFEELKDRAKLQKQRMTQQQYGQIVAIGNYNVACYWSRFKKDVDKTCEFLEKSMEAGYRDFAHMEKDTDLDNVRKDAKYKALIEKYRK